MRTQSSIAVRGALGENWVLVNASPDLRVQLQMNPELQPGRAVRDSAIAAIVLTDAQLDHTTGLLLLRESTQPLQVWCTDAANTDLTQHYPLFNILRRYCGVSRQRIDPDCSFVIESAAELRWRALRLGNRPPPYSPRLPMAAGEDAIALIIEDAAATRRVVYAPALANIDALTWEAMLSAQCVLVDGTFWTDDELAQAGAGRKRAQDMGHLPQSGSGGMIEWLDRLPRHVRRVLIHINNTNPVLCEDSAERAILRKHNIEVAHDGMDILV